MPTYQRYRVHATTLVRVLDDHGMTIAEVTVTGFNDGNSEQGVAAVAATAVNVAAGRMDTQMEALEISEKKRLR